MIIYGLILGLIATSDLYAMTEPKSKKIRLIDQDRKHSAEERLVAKQIAALIDQREEINARLQALYQQQDALRKNKNGDQ